MFALGVFAGLTISFFLECVAMYLIYKRGRLVYVLHDSPRIIDDYVDDYDDYDVHVVEDRNFLKN